MAKTLRQLRRQIRLVGKIHQITRAMQMVAAAKLRRVQQRALEGRTYWQRMQEIVREVSATAPEIDHPLLTPRETQRIGLLVVAGEKGLCGGYNVQVAREADRFLRGLQHPAAVRLTGRKAQSALERGGWAIEDQFTREDRTLPADARRIAQELRRWYETGEVDEVHVCYSQFVSTSRDHPAVVRLLPVAGAEAGDEDGPAPSEYIFEPPAQELFARLLPRYVDAQVYQMLLEASASEHAARMRAMAAATDNAEKMTQRLRMQANRLRQQEITEELLDVVGGAEALR
ncbi:MAG: ATP synthase F1 subunit gamma [Armatimonadetes bacterium]|nr:ATP synthase F1 subunit gamma [Armatimonadota bacterium]